MDLRKAMETVVRDGLNNNQGGIYIEIPENKIEDIVHSVTNNDYFLIEFTDELEDMLAEYLDNHADELGLYEEESE